ncbi:leucine-rich repeat and fibronectin type-III domain-containing protein 4-like [Apostichopus japonicus]|uniref:leucine-rich repeat and fibronectin type-III domain-containing protein 4-like n=1 Tax=Stichopus japonicus TaxID=307972 RepID=UPI003AB2E229
MKTPSFYRILTILLTLVGIVHCQPPQCPTICSCYPGPELNTGVIDCSNRGLTSIPNNLFYPLGGFIAKIDLSNNMLTTLDIDRVFTILRGTTVEVLDFSSNLISDVTGTFDAFEGKDYVTLNLSSNAFTSFPPNVIPVNHQRNKLVLDFSNNRLTELTRHMFAGGNDVNLFGFEFLAKNNLINRIDDETFQGVVIVDTILDLRSNLLTTLSPTFQSPAGIREFRFSGNPWNCDCNLRWIINPMRFLVNHTSMDPPNCVTPVAIQGRPIFNLTSNEFTCLPFRQGPLQRNIVNQDSFTLSCPASADPPTPEISWTVWLPCPYGGDPLKMFFTSDEITMSNIDPNPRAAFRCTAINNAGSVNFDLDIRVDGERGIAIPGTSNAVPPGIELLSSCRRASSCRRP